MTSNAAVAALVLFAAITSPAFAQKKRIPPGGNIAVVADERLAALRVAPTLSARLVRRLSRGRLVSVRISRRNYAGVSFSQVVVTRRTSGWIQSEALIMSGRDGDDERLAHLVGGTDEFERVARARIFLNTFLRSPLRPRVLLALGDAAEEAAEQLSKEATRRFERREIPTDGAPEFSYYLNFNSLDRYNRQGVTFTFDREKKQFHYDGAAWREIVRRYRDSPEAAAAAQRLERFSR
ncbi:MAG TPA: hypothetical protein VN696_18810 [Pyrinomonadaceae bacterium]|nr:hypothetical protein [Pyrinomonadaceae bacterium]